MAGDCRYLLHTVSNLPDSERPTANGVEGKGGGGGEVSHFTDCNVPNKKSFLMSDRYDDRCEAGSCLGCVQPQDN